MKSYATSLDKLVDINPGYHIKDFFVFLIVGFSEKF